MDSDNVKFFYDYANRPMTWKEKITGEGDNIVIDYDYIPYVPCTDTIKAYVFKISEVEGNDYAITQYDDTEYYLKAILVAPQTDADLENGTKLELTIGKKTSTDSDIVWDEANKQIVYGKDTKKEEPFKYDVAPFEFNNISSEAILEKGTINVRKILVGDIMIHLEWL